MRWPRHNKHWSPRAATITGYLGAWVSVALAYAVQRLIGPFVSPVPFVFFFVAVAIAGLRGGVGPSLVALALSAIVVNVTVFSARPGELLSTALFIVAGAIVTAINAWSKRTLRAKQLVEARFSLFVSCVQDYAMFVLDPDGRVISWNDGAARISGYDATEAIGMPLGRLYPEQERRSGVPARTLEQARVRGRVETEGFRLRKNGERFWANVVVTAMHDERGELIGFAKIIRDMTEKRQQLQRLEDSERKYRRLSSELEGRVVERTLELTNLNKELEAFAYSVSHDLRAPLRSIDGFSRALEEDYARALDETGRRYLKRVRAAARRMTQLIDDLLVLARITRVDLSPAPIDVSAIADAVAQSLRERDPARDVEVHVARGLHAVADPRLVRVLLENLLSNAWKFTRHTQNARIDVGREGRSFFVRDNGAGFDPRYAEKLFAPFQRLHSDREFEGSGIGLATAQRIVARHRGEISASGAPGEGATIRFSLGHLSVPPLTVIPDRGPRRGWASPRPS